MFVWKQNGTIECIPEQQAVRLIAVFSLAGGFFGSVLDTIAGSVLFQVLLAAAQQRLIFSVCRFLSGTLWEHLWLTEVERLSKFVTLCRPHTSKFFYFIFGSLHLDTVLHGMMLMMLKSCQYYYGYYGYFFPTWMEQIHYGVLRVLLLIKCLLRCCLVVWMLQIGVKGFVGWWPDWRKQLYKVGLLKKGVN